MTREQRDELRRQCIEHGIEPGTGTLYLFDALDAAERERDQAKGELAESLEYGELMRKEVDSYAQDSKAFADRYVQLEMLRLRNNAFDAERERDAAGEVIRELRQKLAEAGVEGSPPPGRDTLIGTLTRERDAARAEADESKRKNAHLLEALAWAVGFIRCHHPNAENDYPDMRNAVGLSQGKKGLSGEFHLQCIHAEHFKAEADRLRAALETAELRCGYILGACRGEQEMKAEAEEVVRIARTALEGE